MDKVLTVNNWWNGPLSGIATYGEYICIYERIFSPEKDEYSDLYFLTPIDDNEVRLILDDWHRWVEWMCEDNSPEHASLWSGNVDLADIAEQSFDYHRYIKKASFHGTIVNFYSEITDYSVIWEGILC